MTSGRRARGAWVALLATAIACGPRPTPQVPAALGADLVVLVPDPEDGTVGAVSVSSGSATVELTRAGESTTIRTNQPPAPVVVLSEADIQRLFGAALAVLPEPARHFNLYFETGSDALTPESKSLAAEVLTVVKGRVAAEVSIVGHTDTTGTAASNVILGLSRAALIRSLLVDSGLDAALVDTASHGESDLLFPTPDDRPEARNRRVEVSVR